MSQEFHNLLVVGRDSDAILLANGKGRDVDAWVLDVGASRLYGPLPLQVWFKWNEYQEGAPLSGKEKRLLQRLWKKAEKPEP